MAKGRTAGRLNCDTHREHIRQSMVLNEQCFSYHVYSFAHGRKCKRTQVSGDGAVLAHVFALAFVFGAPFESRIYTILSSSNNTRQYFWAGLYIS